MNLKKVIFKNVYLKVKTFKNLIFHEYFRFFTHFWFKHIQTIINRIMMNERIVSPELIITNEPSNTVKPLDPCGLNNVEENPESFKKINEISFECLLNTYNMENFPPENFDLFVCVTLVPVDMADNPILSEHTGSILQAQVFTIMILKCSNSRTRYISHLISIVNKSLIKPNTYCFDIDRETKKSTINGLFVVNQTKFDVNEISEKLVISERNHQYHQSNNGKHFLEYLTDNQDSIEKEVVEKNKLITFNKFRLKLQVLMVDKAEQKSSAFLTGPIYTRAITNRLASSSDETREISLANSSLLNKNDLRILRSSRIYGSTRGGDEIILLTSYVDPFDLQV